MFMTKNGFMQFLDNNMQITISFIWHLFYKDEKLPKSSLKSGTNLTHYPDILEIDKQFIQ